MAPAITTSRLIYIVANLFFYFTMLSSIDANHPLCIGCAYLLLLFSVRVRVPYDGFSKYRHGGCRWLSRHVNSFVLFIVNFEWGRKKNVALNHVAKHAHSVFDVAFVISLSVWRGLNRKDLHSKRLRFGHNMPCYRMIRRSLLIDSAKSKRFRRFVWLFNAIRLICSEMERF